MLVQSIFYNCWSVFLRQKGEYKNVKLVWLQLPYVLHTIWNENGAWKIDYCKCLHTYRWSTLMEASSISTWWLDCWVVFISLSRSLQQTFICKDLVGVTVLQLHLLWGSWIVFSQICVSFVCGGVRVRILTLKVFCNLSALLISSGFIVTVLFF